MAEYIIRKATQDDAAAILIHNEIITNEPHNGILRGPGENLTLDEERAYIASSLATDNALLVIAITPAGEVIAVAGASGGRRKGNRHNASVGIGVNPEWRDKGVGTAILRYIIDWAKNTNIITRIELEVMTHNERAIHVYEKLGFKMEGRRLAALHKEGRYIDIYMMGLLLFNYPASLPEDKPSGNMNKAP